MFSESTKLGPLQIDPPGYEWPGGVSIEVCTLVECRLSEFRIVEEDGNRYLELSFQALEGGFVHSLRTAVGDPVDVTFSEELAVNVTFPFEGNGEVSGE